MSAAVNSPIVGTRVRRRRKALHFTQEGLALVLGHRKAYVQRIEDGTRGTTLEEFVRLCNMLETTPNYLLGYSRRP